MRVNWLGGQKAQAGGQGVASTEVAGGDAVRRPWVIHPFLIAAFPIASLYAHNVYETPVEVMLVPLAITWVATLAVWQVSRLLARDGLWAGLATSMLAASFFGFASLSRFVDRALFYLSDFWIVTQVHVHPLIVLGTAAVVGGLALRYLFWRSRHLGRWTSYLNVFTLILVAMPTAGAMSARFGEHSDARTGGALPPVADRPGGRPDIYFIVLDGYARSDVMKELFDFDNEPFLGRLERQGFFVARQSTSNYCQTRLSLASTLNADYLPKLIDPGSRDLLPISALIKENLVSKLLHAQGYKYVTFATGFEPTDHPDSDLYLLPRSGIPEFDQLLIEMTPIAPLFSSRKEIDRYTLNRDRTLFLLDWLPTVAGMKEPTFTFAHIVSPHPPFVFGENGEDVSPRQLELKSRVLRPLVESFGTAEYFRDSYRKQSTFLTKQVERSIERIIANSPEPPIIILQSDHGSWLHYHPDDVEATDLRERFGILNCVYSKGRKIEGLNDRMTPVNTFRAVLKDVIGADLPPLEERNFFSTFSEPLNFTDVTERLHSDRDRKRIYLPPREYQGLLQQF